MVALKINNEYGLKQRGTSSIKKTKTKQNINFMFNFHHPGGPKAGKRDRGEAERGSV